MSCKGTAAMSTTLPADVQHSIGDLAMHGREGVRFFTKLKTVTSRWLTGIRAGADYVTPALN